MLNQYICYFKFVFDLLWLYSNLNTMQENSLPFSLFIRIPFYLIQWENQWCSKCMENGIYWVEICFCVTEWYWPAQNNECCWILLVINFTWKKWQIENLFHSKFIWLKSTQIIEPRLSFTTEQKETEKRDRGIKKIECDWHQTIAPILLCH